MNASEPLTEAEERRQRIEGWLYPTVTVVAGLALGLAVPDDNSLELPPSWLSRVSSVLGWTYFVAWSLTFYPQVRPAPRAAIGRCPLESRFAAAGIRRSRGSVGNKIQLSHHMACLYTCGRASGSGARPGFAGC